jgi:hypothetical protein
MTRHYHLALTADVTTAALIASVSLGFWTGLVAAQLPPAAVLPPSSARS